MRNEEWAIIETLEQPARKLAKELFDYAIYICDGTQYRPTVPSYSVPWKSGRRNKAQQKSLFDRGLSKCDGSRKKSRHQFGLAIHVGLRYRRSNGFIPANNSMPSNAEQLFRLILKKARELGFTCGADWKKSKPGDKFGWDSQHLELK